MASVELISLALRMALPSGLRVAPGLSNTRVPLPELRSGVKPSSRGCVTPETYRHVWREDFLDQVAVPIT